jgi:hypothetical protein
MKFFTYLTFCCSLPLFVPEARSQEVTRTPNASVDPCPGGVGTMELQPRFNPRTLQDLVALSDLIVLGSVSNVQAAVLVTPDRLNLTQTDSEVVVRQLLSGALAPSIGSILVTQTGGKVGHCSIVVPDDPLVKFNEDYVLFLKVDNRDYPPKAVSLPRYAVVGVWSGKVKIVDGKVEFAAAANPTFRQYDKTDVNSFVALVQRTIKAIAPNQQSGRERN